MTIGAFGKGEKLEGTARYDIHDSSCRGTVEVHAAGKAGT